ncbi:MAG: methyltransferase domain-containing protein [Planctomycetota bacterium]|jgi:ubiquinone/menaquinone biosynthesis C-methylase UbiE
MDIKTDVLKSGPEYDTVKKYYGEVVQKTSDLKTDACCTTDAVPVHIKEVLPLIENEIKDKYYGCGSPVPLSIEGLKMLDLGCGTGRDCFIMSKLAGPKGFVYGIDMTENQVSVALKYIDKQTEVFGYEKPNVKFICDYIENLSKHFEKESLDVVTSNCVINLTEDKEIVLQKVYDVLKFGGEMYFADVYADRRVPESITRDPILRGECLGGALYYRDFERIAKKAGFVDPRIVSGKLINIQNPQIKDMVGNIQFCSITYRLWKLKDLEDACEDYGHIAVYDGQISGSPFKFELDDKHVFYKNKPERVCGNTAIMLSGTRLNKYFQITGNFKEHFGAFRSQSSVETKETKNSSNCC